MFFILIYYDSLVQLCFYSYMLWFSCPIMFLFPYIMIFLSNYLFYSYILWLSCPIMSFIPILYIPIYYSYIFLYITIFLSSCLFYSYILWFSCPIIFFIPIYYDFLFQLSFLRMNVCNCRSQNQQYIFHISHKRSIYFKFFCVTNVVITELII